MTRISMETLVSIIGGDHELVAVLVREQIISAAEAGYELRDVDRAMAARTLIRELHIDAGAVSIILRLREQLAIARAELVRLRALTGDDR
jgi:hypothetical protein